jgi:hypothetical protein
MGAPVLNAAPPLQRHRRRRRHQGVLRGRFEPSDLPLGDAQAQRIAVVLGDSTHACGCRVGRFGRDRRWQVVPLIKLGCVPASLRERVYRVVQLGARTIRDLHPV